MLKKSKRERERDLIETSSFAMIEKALENELIEETFRTRKILIKTKHFVFFFDFVWVEFWAAFVPVFTCAIKDYPNTNSYPLLYLPLLPPIRISSPKVSCCIDHSQWRCHQFSFLSFSPMFINLEFESLDKWLKTSKSSWV